MILNEDLCLFFSQLICQGDFSCLTEWSCESGEPGGVKPTTT